MRAGCRCSVAVSVVVVDVVMTGELRLVDKTHLLVEHSPGQQLFFITLPEVSLGEKYYQ